MSSVDRTKEQRVTPTERAYRCRWRWVPRPSKPEEGCETVTAENVHAAMKQARNLASPNGGRDYFPDDIEIISVELIRGKKR